jgi:tRNA(fMet)-specific endonuclease VapC
MYLLDTNHCSYIIDGQPQVIAAVSSLSGSNLGINIITYAELLYMSDKSAQKERNTAALRSFLARVDLPCQPTKIPILPRTPNQLPPVQKFLSLTS